MEDEELTLLCFLRSVFLALALRFDYHLALKRASIPFRPSRSFPKPYFLSCFIAYILGASPFLSSSPSRARG